MAESSNAPHLAEDLLRIHRAITRGLTVGLAKGEEYIQTSFPDAEMRQGFSMYVRCLGVLLDAHHNGEDEISFPALKKILPSTPYERLSADHEEIETLLALLNQAIVNIDEQEDKNSLTQLVDCQRKISEIWKPHIGIEEQSFSQEALNAAMDAEEQNRIAGAMAKHGQEHSTPPFLVLPFLLFNLEPKDRIEMVATMPPMITQELIPKVWKDQWAPMKPFLLD